ncbi:hypothetical protein MA16_Dca000876 [Dendrobium catenatum]|uniref:Uncharacterized protein n=1 Tax=Dendrobium catenatum TaxID=906689 RepID=A0A2I0WV42_9ASPA|nr:hypothetical protein MA16_Dca000876 [Dendrobium catenatum]
MDAFGFSYLHWDSSQVEVQSILELRSFTHDWMLEFDGIIIEGENNNVMELFWKTMLNKDAVKEETLNWKELSFLNDFKQVLFLFVDRDYNKLVDMCANYAFFLDFFWDVFNSDSVPPSLISLLKEECDGCS